MAAFIRRLFVQLRILYFRHRKAAHVVQIDDAGQGSAGPAVTRSHSHTAVSQYGRNGMGRGSVYHHAGLFLFLPAFLQPAGRPGIGGDRAVDQVRVICLQFAPGLDGVEYIITGFIFFTFGHHLAVADQRFGIAADLVVGTGHAEGGRNALPIRSHINYAGIVGDGFVALRHHAHIACTVNIRIFNFRRSTVINIIMAAGTAHCRGSFHCHGNAHGHAGNIAVGHSADIQIANVQRRRIRFICIGHASHGIICNAVHAHSHHAGQEGIRTGELQRRRAGIHF